MGTQGAEVCTSRPAWGKDNLTITEKKTSKFRVGLQTVSCSYVL